MSPCGRTDEATKTTTLDRTPKDTADDEESGRYTFLPGRPRWHGRTLLTYAVSTTATVEYIPLSTVRAVVRTAFARWADVIPMRFVEADRLYNDNDPDITLGFHPFTGGKCAGCGTSDGYDGAKTLAHSSRPMQGWIHVNTAWRWTVNLDVDMDPSAYDLESIVIHEIGHVLGLDHSTSLTSVMYKSFDYRTKKIKLNIYDVLGIQELYGATRYFSFKSYFKQELLRHNQRQEEEKRKRSFWRRGLAYILPSGIAS
uniref:Peptidase metallopeptidase domain-containing protein n=1 Tax=Leersia perrieri TaxID=77586 RepID=A0A0D9XMC4_9ORYZ